MPLIKRIGLIVASLAGFLIVGDIIGVLGCFFGAFTSSRRGTVGAIYAVWFVLGVFTGMLHYFFSSDLCSENSTPGSTKRKKSIGTAISVIGVSAAGLIALSFILYHFTWQRGVWSDAGYVPASMSATMTYFATILPAMIMTSWMESSEPESKKTKR